MTVFSWTDDRVENLKRLWEAGLSASQIAAELGHITRNSVIGKVHRLGLSGRKKPAARPKVRVVRPQTRDTRFGTLRPKRHAQTALAHALAIDEEAEPEVSVYDNVIPMTQRCTLQELTDQNCHWPVGDPQQADFYFCGGKSLTALPYCAHHCRVAYQAPVDRVRRRRY